MTKLAVEPALGARLIGPLEITDVDGKTLGFFLTPAELDHLRRAADAQRTLAYARGRSILPDDELVVDAANVDDLCPDAEMDGYRGQS